MAAGTTERIQRVEGGHAVTASCARRHTTQTPRSPLLAAQNNSNLEVITTLLTAGADIDGTEIYGHTPLMGASSFNLNPEVAMTLLNAGASVRSNLARGRQRSTMPRATRN